MAKKLYEEESVQDIAAAIREKNGETTTYKIGEMGGRCERHYDRHTNRGIHF